MCQRYLAIIIWVVLGLCISVSCRAKEAQGSFGISITILSACATIFDETRHQVDERCSFPLPYRIDTLRVQPGQLDDGVPRDSGESTQQRTFARGGPHDARSVTVVTIVY